MNRKTLKDHITGLWRRVNGITLRIKVGSPRIYRLIVFPPMRLVEKYLRPLFLLILTSREKNKGLNEALSDRPLQPYESEYQDNEDYSGYETDIKAVAFYLPQYHSIPENDEWWGKGFTDWVNTRKTVPRFDGHYQPREPHPDFGYYDLSRVNILKKQAGLAKEHGIYGFAFYYYWFDGKRLLEKPIELLAKHPEIDLRFCICWANENWTRSWDGAETSILMAQKYSQRNDIEFISGLKRFFADPRYIRIGGKPVILVYRPLDLPDPKMTFSRWRRWCLENGVGEIQILAVRAFPHIFGDGQMHLGDSIDKEVEFPPHNTAPTSRIDGRLPASAQNETILYDYHYFVDEILRDNAIADRLPYPIYRTVMTGWDNCPRRGAGAHVWYGYSLEGYYRWLRHIIRFTRDGFPEAERLVFINAWNEWAEGTYLEPDKKYGYANINTTSRALFDLPRQQRFHVLNRVKEPKGTGEAPGTIAVHAHVIHPEQADELVSYINNIPYPFDCYVTTDTIEKKREIAGHVSAKCNAGLKEIRITPNVGEDVASFVVGCKDVLDRYDYICHVFTKKDASVQWGDLWRRYLLDNVLGSKDRIRSIVGYIRDGHDVGIILPPAYPLVGPDTDWAGCKERCSALLSRLGYPSALPDIPVPPAGDMFWVRGRALAGLAGAGIEYADFEEEAGRAEPTLAHTFKRLWAHIPRAEGYRPLVALPRETRNGARSPVRKRIAFFVHFSNHTIVEQSDLYYLEKLSGLVDTMVVVSNSELTGSDRQKVGRSADRIIVRDNKGFDFGAWRDGMQELGFDSLNEYDELILANNSCHGPIFPFDEMFSEMETKPCDFWGVTVFPENKNPRRAEARFLKTATMPQHIQSYFMVFRRSVLGSQAFRSFWMSVADEDDSLKVVARYEAQLTPYLQRHGFKWDCYIWESLYLQQRDNSDPAYNAFYGLPVDFMMLRCPFIKKKFRRYVSEEEIPVVLEGIRKLTDYPADLIDTGRR